MSAPETLPPPIPLNELERTFGALFIGFILATVLYGFTFFQTYVYFSRYPKDDVWTKTTVGVLCALDTTTSALISQALYFYLITNFLAPIGLLDATATFCAENGLAILASFIVQIYFAVRVWSLSGRFFGPSAAIAAAAFVAFGFGITMTVQIFIQRRLADFGTTKMEVVAGVSQGFASLACVFIVGAMNYYLQPEHNSGTQKIEGWFDKLVAYGINRGLSVTIIQFAYFLVFITMPSKQIWMPFHLVVSKMYINTLLCLLNSRGVYRGRGIREGESITQRKSSGVGASSTESAASGAIRFNVMDNKTGINVEVSRTVELDTSPELGKIAAIGDEETGSINENDIRKASLSRASTSDP